MSRFADDRLERPQHVLYRDGERRWIAAILERSLGRPLEFECGRLQFLGAEAACSALQGVREAVHFTVVAFGDKSMKAFTAIGVLITEDAEQTAGAIHPALHPLQQQDRIDAGEQWQYGIRAIVAARRRRCS